MWWPGGARLAWLVCLWYCTSAAHGVVGSLALARLPFPLTLAVVQLAGAALFTGPALYLTRAPPAPRLPRRLILRVLMPLAAAKFFTTACSTLAIWRIPVSYAHTVKATTPLWTALLSWAVLGERSPPRVVAALGVIACGAALASLTELRPDAAGLAAALAAAATLAAQHLASKRALRREGVGLHPLQLLRVLSAGALALALPVWLYRDLFALIDRGMPNHTTLTLVLADGTLSVVQAGAALAVLARVSPLSYGVASAAKRAAVIAASLLVLGNPAPPANLAGMALTLIGVALYDRARREPSSPTMKPLLPI